MAFKMKNTALMNKARMAGDNRSAYKHIVEVGPEKGSQAPNPQGAYTHNSAHRNKKFDMNHQLISKDKKKEGTKKDSPMKAHEPGHDTPKEGGMLDQVDVKAKRGRKKFYETTKHTGGGNVETFKHKKDGSVVRRDDIQAGWRSGGGFRNRRKKEGWGSALANMAPIRYLRTVKRELGGEFGRSLGLGHRDQNPEHLEGKHKLTKKKK